MGYSLCALTCLCLLSHADDQGDVPRPTVSKVSVPGLPPPLVPFPTAPPLCLRLRATTNVFLAPIPMPLDILSDPPSGWLHRWHSGKLHLRFRNTIE